MPTLAIILKYNYFFTSGITVTYRCMIKGTFSCRTYLAGIFHAVSLNFTFYGPVSRA